VQGGFEDCLMFMFAYHDGGGVVRFRTSAVPLPRKGARFGVHLAVDPKSRALAVSAAKDQVHVCALKSVAQIREETIHEPAFQDHMINPIESQRTIPVEGTIQHIEFLTAGPKMPNTVVLVLVVTKDKKTRLVRFEWESNKKSNAHGSFAPSHVIPDHVPEHQRLERAPLLLIPFSISLGFMLVCEQGFSLYQDISQGWVQGVWRPYDNEKKRWTAWARPVRGEHFNTKNDTVYMVREDGLVRLWEWSATSSIDGNHNVGNLSVNVDKAFAALDPGPDTGRNNDGHAASHDMLITPGNMSNGGLFRFFPRANARPEKLLPSWSPIWDFALLSSTTKLQSSMQSSVRLLPDTQPSRPDRVFACVGKGVQHGAICEIRYGLEAIVCEENDPTAINNIISGCTALWVIPNLKTEGFYLLVSDPESSDTLDYQWANEDADFTELGLPQFLQGDFATICAGRVCNGRVLQVTPGAIKALIPRLRPELPSDGRDDSIPLYDMYVQCYLPITIEAEENTCFIKASIEPRTSTVLVVASTMIGHHLMAYNATGTCPDLALDRICEGGDTELSSEPTCLLLRCIRSMETYAFVGTVDEYLHLYLVDEESGRFQLLQSLKLEGDYAICESLIVVKPKGGPDDQYVLLCGLRDGTLQVILWKPCKHSCKLS
jgi:hypothetical protein